MADCAKLVDLVSPDFSVETRNCIQSGGSPTSCLSKSLGGLTPTPGQKQFATTFCSICAGGLVPGCEELFFAQGDTVPEQLQVAGKLILPLSDDLVGHLETECAQANPLTCVANFATCAQGVLAKQALPTETAQCLLDAIISGGGSQLPGECGDPDAGGGGSDGGGAGTGGGAGGGGAGGAAGSSGTCSKYTGSCETFQVGGTACNTCMHSNCCTPIQACLDDEYCGGLVACASDNCSGAADLGACMNQSCGPCLDPTSADLAAAIGECLESSCNAECS